jgi:hypothetical protein
MDARELRIGNIIKDDRKAQDWRFATHRIISDLASNPNIELYHPVPLTEEWLIKFGFRPHPRGGFYTIIHNSPGIEAVIQWKQNGYLGIETAQGLDGELTNHTQLPVLIKHVHQLQNLYFALTGEELINHPKP